MRLNAIAPAKLNYLPFDAANTPLSYSTIDRNEGLLYLNNLANDAHKPSFALEAIVFNPNMYASTKNLIQDAQCSKMEKMLNNAPCCGPCINCAARPESLFEKVPKKCLPDGTEIPNRPGFLGNVKDFFNVLTHPKILYNAVLNNIDTCRDANGKIKYEGYQYIKEEAYELGWFVDDANATTFPCDKKRDKSYVHTLDEHHFNGIDFLQDYNLWLMACGGRDNEDYIPKLIQPTTIAQVEGCENEGKVHIQGPDVVCKGEKVDFNISTEGVHTPIDGQPTWALGGSVVRNVDTYDDLIGTKPTIQNYMHTAGITFPNSTGSQTISYQFSVAGQTKTITKTVTVMDKPDAPTITNMQVNQERCIFTVELGNLGNNSLSAPSGSVAGSSVKFVMESEPYTATVYTINRCGVSEATTIEVPAATSPCRIEPRIVKNNSTGINPNEITLWSNPVSKTITVKCDVLYNAPFETRLYDLTGRLVHTQHFETVDITIDYSNQNLQSGLYIFALYSGFEFLKSSKFYLENY